MAQVYVALGISSDGSYYGTMETVLAVSRDEVRIKAFIAGLLNPNHARDKRGLEPIAGAFDKYVHEGKPYLNVEVAGPVPDLDGPQIIVAHTVGTINM